MNNENLPKITVGTESVGDLMRVDVNVSNVPSDLFGVAFHLKISGAEWNLARYEGGDAFALSKEAPLILVTEKVIGEDKEIIFGAVKMAQDKSKVSDGALVSFYINTEGATNNVGKGADTIDFSFSDTHLTVVDGGRRDVDAVWEDGNFVFGAEADVGTDADVLGADVVGSTQLQTEVIAKTGGIGYDSLSQIYLFLGSAFVSFLVIYVVCCIFARRKRGDVGIDERIDGEISK